MNKIEFPNKIKITISENELIDFDYNDVFNCPIAKQLKSIYTNYMVLAGSSTISIYSSSSSDIILAKKEAEYKIEEKLDQDIHDIFDDKVIPRELKGILTKISK